MQTVGVQLGVGPEIVGKHLLCRKWGGYAAPAGEFGVGLEHGAKHLLESLALTRAPEAQA
eukprot:1161827-Pelagomonas_calceolata.AAC.7